MQYISDFHESDRVRGVYLCKNVTSAVTKNGKPYLNMILQDKTGTVDAKVWEPNDPGIDDFEKLDFIEINGDVVVFNSSLQLNVKRVRKASEGEYAPEDYLPVSPRNNDEMYREVLKIVESVQNPYYHKLMEMIFVEDQEFISRFRRSSAAKTVHHGYVGGLMEHTLSVTNLCRFYCKSYPILKYDLLITAAMCHDIAKTKELSPFPENDYTDEGQLLGHIVMGSQMIAEYAARIPDFPPVLLQQLQHCILAHHGKYEYGSPKLPALVEAVALNFADDTDAKMEIFRELLEKNYGNNGWLGFNKMFDSNVHATLGDL
ncbi:MAG: HD domain-containing protein [Lachnospiraceae bacterium]|nr:HD domain-containing protein [Lachnospiraceae bacterium]